MQLNLFQTVCSCLFAGILLAGGLSRAIAEDVPAGSANDRRCSSGRQVGAQAAEELPCVALAECLQFEPLYTARVQVGEQPGRRRIVATHCRHKRDAPSEKGDDGPRLLVGPVEVVKQEDGSVQTLLQLTGDERRVGATGVVPERAAERQIRHP